MSELETKAVEILDKLENLITGYAPEVASLALSAVRVSAIGSMVSGILSMLVLIFYIMYGQRVWRWMNKEEAKAKEIDKWNDWDFQKGAFIAVAVLSSLFCSVLFLSTVFDVWTYVAVFNPELALAHKITGL